MGWPPSSRPRARPVRAWAATFCCARAGRPNRASSAASPMAHGAIQIALRARQRPNPILEWLEVREIRVRVGRRGHPRPRGAAVDQPARPAHRAGARTRAGLHAALGTRAVLSRDQTQLRKTDVLQSHTVETGAQEIAALVLASAVLAAERQRAAGALPALRISFPKLLDVVTAVWWWTDLGDGILSAPQLDRIAKRGYARMRQCLTPVRRARTCPRAVGSPHKRGRAYAAAVRAGAMGVSDRLTPSHNFEGIG